jgi:hypothetical protein
MTALNLPLLYVVLVVLIALLVHLVTSGISLHRDRHRIAKDRANYLLKEIDCLDHYTGRSFISELDADDQRDLAEMRKWASK